MKGKACFFRILFTFKSNKIDLCCGNRNLSPYAKVVFFSTTINGSTGSSPLVGLGESVQETKTLAEPLKCAADVFRSFGCSESCVRTIFSRQPSLRNASATNLEYKLTLLKRLGLTTTQLVSMVSCRPRFLLCRLNHFLDERLSQLLSLFDSKELFIKAIVRNPSLMVYDVEKDVKPVFSLYEEMGLTKSDVISMLLLRPTLVSRTHFSGEKLDYICRTGISKESKMFKYLVTIIGVSRFETIREKVANFEKYGFSEDEVLKLFGRSPLLMTFSVEKIQRNMTFLIATMKLPAKKVCVYPFLLFSNLEVILKPRMLLAGKLQDMDLFPQINGRKIFRALRMSEERFLKVYVECQEKKVQNELLSYYKASKGMKRLAESSKQASHTSGFPF